MDDNGKTRTPLLDDVAILRQQLSVLHAARIDADSGIETVRESLVVLTADLLVISAHRVFSQMCLVTTQETRDSLLYELGYGQWVSPALRPVLEALLPIGLVVYAFAVTYQFPSIGRKVMLLKVRRIDHDSTLSRILLAIEDITEHERAAPR